VLGSLVVSSYTGQFEPLLKDGRFLTPAASQKMHLSLHIQLLPHWDQSLAAARRAVPLVSSLSLTRAGRAPPLLLLPETVIAPVVNANAFFSRLFVHCCCYGYWWVDLLLAVGSP